MILKDISFDDPRLNLFYDDVLLYQAEKVNGQEVLRFWESPSYFVVLGRISSLENDVNLEKVKEDKIPVLRRSSGGGTVLQGHGCLNYSVILSKERNPAISDLRKSYEIILGKVVLGLRNLGVEADFFPISDIALKDGHKKFSGNAQKRGRNFILHHGTILYCFDLNLIEKYLLMPKDIPEYRKKRGHLSFVSNINCDVDLIKNSLTNAFGIHKSVSEIDQEEKDLLDKFLETKIVLETI